MKMRDDWIGHYGKGGYSFLHCEAVGQLVEQLEFDPYQYAQTLWWGNYPELSPEETASAALDGFVVQG